MIPQKLGSTSALIAEAGVDDEEQESRPLKIAINASQNLLVLGFVTYFW